ncbi:pyridoxamine 5'-phosphate oxidase family protein [Brevibacillus humidisoli]|uniref:pyridoxamine 5'-phosphate oxidase family protein n=1 Tax=Brevibacillus humidisoli TaxID=2895522 RepID=UPI001E3363AC|nr:pyridoxamine 5'-phosphate oxidase family protein [Brevibacillus humidisoli]UFJ42288.1 pyridoxamine 5'-phosphate oxidase family protein [Brevibacillus humidisoli]
MYEIRYKKRACDDQDRIVQFLNRAKTGYLGLADGSLPYVIPLNFVWLQNSIYFHGAASGRKTEIMAANPNACFTVSEEDGTIANPVPAKTDTGYFSVIIFGKVEPVSDLAKATSVMQALLDKYVPGYFDKRLSQNHVEKYRSSLGSRTAVYELKAISLTAKENPLDENRRFYPGRTKQQDLQG